MRKGKLVFGAIQGDEAGEKIISILRKEGYPTTIIREEEKYQNGVLVLFFTPKEYPVKSSCIECAAHKFYNEVGLTPFVIGCNRKIIRREEENGIREAVTDIAKRYWLWEYTGFHSDSRFFPPWGIEPTGLKDSTKRGERFLRWKEETIKYLSS